MNKKCVLFLVVILIAGYFGCTKHTVKLEQDEPFRVDVNMRIDVYQHITNHANTIEDMINDSSQPQSYNFISNTLSFLPDFTASVYAREKSVVNNLSPAAVSAIEKRKMRRSDIIVWESKGVLGENAKGLTEIVNDSGLSAGEKNALTNLVVSENRDRAVIYQELAQIEGTSAEQVGKVYSVSIQKNAPTGTPIQVLNAGRTYSWTTK